MLVQGAGSMNVDKLIGQIREKNQLAHVTAVSLSVRLQNVLSADATIVASQRGGAAYDLYAPHIDERNETFGYDEFTGCFFTRADDQAKATLGIESDSPENGVTSLILDILSRSPNNRVVVLDRSKYGEFAKFVACIATHRCRLNKIKTKLPPKPKTANLLSALNSIKTHRSWDRCKQECANVYFLLFGRLPAAA